MASSRKLILLELNEVPFQVVDAFCEAQPDSDIAALMKDSAQLVTTCEDEIELDPWISWPTLHRGVSDTKHRILSLGQTLDKVDNQYPPMWRMITSAGRTAGVFGSIHSSHVPPSMEAYKFYMPDFFDEKVFAYPTYLKGFQQFNLEMTRRSARNVNTSIPRSAIREFLRSAIATGFSVDTAREVIAQLAGERKERRVRLRRRSLQALLMADVFTRMLKRDMPDFSTLYSNHVAAAMHRYWAAAFPGDYKPNLTSPEWQRLYQREVFEAVRIASKIIGKLRRLVDSRKDTVLLIASSMGQHATEHPPSDGLYTIRDLGKFMANFGIPEDQFRQKHAMVPCTGVLVDASIRDDFQKKLNQFRIGESRMVESEKEISPMSYALHDGNFFSLYMNFDAYTGEHVGYLGNEPKTFEDLGIGFLPHEDGVSVTAHHHPDGILLIYDPTRPSSAGSRLRVSTLEIAPAVLAHYGIAAPDYMVKPSAPLRQALALN
jgi:Type I phosphodiesterase / nucleotide pyrophosphatase